MSFEEKDLTGDISGLGPFDLEALQDWEYKFMSKYVKVGTIMKTVPVTDGAASSASENTEPAAISTKSGPKDCPAEHGAEPKEGNPAESEANPAGHGEESKDFGSPEESSKEFLSWVRMADIKPSIQRWEDMAIDGLVQIFRELNMNELAPVSQVCRSWRLACSDLLVWSTLDLGLLKSNFIQTRVSPYIWVDGKSDKRLRRVLRTAMALSCGNITCMIFHFNLYMKDEHLDDIAKRCPHIKRLVLPAWDCMTTNAICQAISRWQGLESMTMPWTSDSPYIMEEISRSCKNFSQLKIMDAFDMQFATSIAANIPKLRVLSLRCSMVTKEALMFVLDCMENLEVLNISHCILLEGHFPSKLVRRQLDDTIMQKASRLREFFHCQSNSCTSCQRMITDKGYMKWWKYEEWFWRQDEVSSLGLGDYGRLFDQRCINQVQD